MNPELTRGFDQAAEHLHSKLAGNFVVVGDRWYARIQVDGNWVWITEGARQRFCDTIPPLAQLLPPDPWLDQLRHHMSSQWGLRQVTGRAAALFRATHLPAPAPAPEPPAPEAGN